MLFSRFDVRLGRPGTAREPNEPPGAGAPAAAERLHYLDELSRRNVRSRSEAGRVVQVRHDQIDQAHSAPQLATSPGSTRPRARQRAAHHVRDRAIEILARRAQVMPNSLRIVQRVARVAGFGGGRAADDRRRRRAAAEPIASPACPQPQRILLLAVQRIGSCDRVLDDDHVGVAVKQLADPRAAAVKGGWCGRAAHRRFSVVVRGFIEPARLPRTWMWRPAVFVARTTRHVVQHPPAGPMKHAQSWRNSF